MTSSQFFIHILTLPEVGFALATKKMQALAASGLRSLRYAREVDGLGKVVALDNDKGNTHVSKLLS